MAERPILRLLNPRSAARQTGGPRNIPRPQGPSRRRQGIRFQPTFNRLAEALDTEDPTITLRQDPSGIAPERALVFITAGEIQNFSRAARSAGLEIIAEIDMEEVRELPQGFQPAAGRAELSPTLYATISTIEAFGQILALWRAHQRGGNAPRGSAPWWNLFDLLLELRPWGPEDRFPESVREAILERLPESDDEEANLEIEIVPTANSNKREAWRRETEQKVLQFGGSVIDRSSIDSDGFIYEAILARLTAGAIREMIDNSLDVNGLASLEGVQFILPQTIGQAGPNDPDADTVEYTDELERHTDGPIRAALFDGTPVAAHAALDGGIVIEDVHDLVRLSQVNQRHHATAMASLILRGDLRADGAPLANARVVSVPLLIDSDDEASSPANRLFVDLLYVALVHLFSGDEPAAPDVFVVNLSIGIYEMRFAGRLCALARLIDWWAAKEGVLFVISAGNIHDDLFLLNTNQFDFENADLGNRRATVQTALRESSYDRCLLAPSEALNGLTVGAISEDLAEEDPPPDVAGIVRIDADGDREPAVSSARGLGPFRAIKPDLLAAGGVQEVRVWQANEHSRLRVVESQRRGLYVAVPAGRGQVPTGRSRGTSCSAALTTRAILQCAESLTEDGGPFQGQELPREDLSLLTRALAVNSARWPDSAHSLYETELDRLGRNHHRRAKEEVARCYGHGPIDAELMIESPDGGVTLVGLGSVKKDQAEIFDLPLPESLAGERLPRSMRVTLAWFSPVEPSSARYRQASLEAVAADTDGDDDEDKDPGWYLQMKGQGPDDNMVKRGTVWSRRLVHNRLTAPAYDDGATIPIRVQCRDSGGSLDPDLEIRFAVAATLEIEAEIEFDVHQEVLNQIRVRLQQ